MQIKKFYHYGQTKKEVCAKVDTFLNNVLKEKPVDQIKCIARLDRCEPEEIFIDYKFRTVTEIEI